MKNFENINRESLNKDLKLESIPEDFNKLSVEEAFNHKHVVFEVNEFFEKTKINLFDNFSASYLDVYDSSKDDENSLKRKLNDSIYAFRFDPAFFIRRGSLAGYIEELKTLMFPDLKNYKDPEVYMHEVVHSIGCIYRNSEGSKIEGHQFYNELNEGITEKMTVEMVGKKDEAYSAHVKCVQIIDSITGGAVNKAFEKNDVEALRELYDEKVEEGAFEKLVMNMHGVQNTLKNMIDCYYKVEEFEEKEDISSLKFKEDYNAIKEIILEEDRLRLGDDKEKYLLQVEKTDQDLEKFETKKVDYVLEKETLLKYDNGNNLDLICKRMVSTINDHFDILLAKSETVEEQRELAQKLCDIKASFDFSNIKIETLESVIESSASSLYEKLNKKEFLGNTDIYKGLNVQHNLKWLDVAAKKAENS